MLKMIPVKSSLIQAIGYDEEQRELYVDFTGGTRWAYADFSPEFFAAMMAAPSVGKFFIHGVKDCHVGRKVEPMP